jgi:hypothetical protein
MRDEDNFAAAKIGGEQIYRPIRATSSTGTMQLPANYANEREWNSGKQSLP